MIRAHRIKIMFMAFLLPHLFSSSRAEEFVMRGAESRISSLSFPFVICARREAASSKRNFHCERPLSVSGPLCQLAKSLALLGRAGVLFDFDTTSGAITSKALFMPIRSDGNRWFVKDDVSCLGMPRGHTRTDPGTPASSLLRSRCTG